VTDSGLNVKECCRETICELLLWSQNIGRDIGHIVRVGKASVQAMYTVTEKKLSGGVESETTHEVLKVDWLSFSEPGFKLMDHNFSVTVEELEIADPVSSECWTSYGTMESVW